MPLSLNKISTRHITLLGALIMVVLTAIAYAPVTRNGFIWDDDANITLNPVIQDPAGLPHIWAITRSEADRRSTAAAQYFPVTHTTLWLQWQIHGAWAPGYHIANVMLHLAGALVLWTLLRELGLSPLAAWLAALLYVLHPVAVESVAWATERKNTVSSLFFLLSLWWFIKFFVRYDTAAKLAGKARTTFVVAVFLFVLAILGKTNAIVLPAILGMIIWARQNGRVTKRQIMLIAPLMLLGFVFGAVAVYREYNVVGKFEDEFRHNGIERLLMVTHTPWMYLSKALWPHPIMFFYPKWDINAAVFWQYLPGPLLLGVLITLFILRQRITPWPFAALLCYLIAIAPFAGFFDAFAFRYSLYADHWQYLALPAITPLMAWVLVKGMTMATPMLRGLAVSVAIMAIALFTVQTHRLTYEYRDESTHWVSVLKYNPNAWIAYNNLAVLFRKAGLVHESLQASEKAIALTTVEEVRINHAMALIGVNRRAEGEAELKTAIEEGKRSGRPALNAMFNLAYLRTLEGRMPEALELYAAILEERPDHLPTVLRLGDIFRSNGRLDLAAERFAQAIALAPHLPDGHVKLAEVLTMKGEWRRAMQHITIARQKAPDSPTIQKLYDEIAARAATQPR